MEIIKAVKQHISSAIMKNVDGFILDDNHPLIEQGIIDSLGILSLLAFIEEKFSIHISVDELTPENFETPLMISRLIESKQSVQKEV